MLLLRLNSMLYYFYMACVMFSAPGLALLGPDSLPEEHPALFALEQAFYFLDHRNHDLD
jgi:hypothetical protein